MWKLHREPLAVIFAKSGKFQYAARNERSPWLDFQEGDQLPALPRVGPEARTSEMVETDARDWIRSSGPVELALQILPQADDRSMILLHAAAGRADDEDR